MTYLKSLVAFTALSSSTCSAGEHFDKFLAEKGITFSQLALQNSVQDEFKLLDEFSAKQEFRRTPSIAERDRDRDCTPYIENQVFLKNGKPMSASFVSPAGKHRENFTHFIASQAPFPHHVDRFWSMVVDHDIHQMVMLTEFKHANGFQLADTYWPLEKEHPLVFGELKVTLLDEKWLFPEEVEHIQIRRFRVEGPNLDRVVTHYWYRNWIDQSVPRKKAVFSKLLEVVREEKQESNPVLVHCAAGIGRTGVFIALYHQAENPEMPLFQIIVNLREQRPWMVGQIQQYLFCKQYNN